MTFEIPAVPDFTEMARVKLELEETYYKLNAFIEKMNHNLDVSAPRIKAAVDVFDGPKRVGSIHWMPSPSFTDLRPDESKSWEVMFGNAAERNPVCLASLKLRERMLCAHHIGKLADEIVRLAKARKDEFDREASELVHG